VEDNMSGPLEGSVALVTGCGRQRGMGRAIALALAEAGADVAVTDLARTGVRNEFEPDAGGNDEWLGIDSLAAEIAARGRRATALVGDVGDEADAARLVSEALHELGQVDILVNNAAAPHGQDRNYTWETPPEAFDLVMRVNTRGPFLMSRAVLPQLLERQARGRIVNIASLAGRMGVPKRAAYCASKFAVVGLTQVMALELAPHGVTVNAICPGTMDTDRNVSTRAQVERGEEDAATAAAMNPPVGRRGVPADVARTVVFLADPASDFVTGQSINVDGGLRPM
jgi:NAD(P)-dependent dehydrogenase (short-subunit alcohol dehydrogenase family)